MKRTVMKFGGSSLSTVEKMKEISNIIVKRSKEEQLVIVVSAMGNTTDELLAMAKNAVENPRKKDLDLLLSTGEMVSAALLSVILNSLGASAVALTGFQAGIQTRGNHTHGRIIKIVPRKIRRSLNSGKIVIITGFQGLNRRKNITTLGRGGSDTTAVALAARLSCPCEIYTDVVGVMTCDPKVYPEAKKLDTISYRDMRDLAYSGVKVMAYRAVEIGEKYHVPIYIAKSSMNQTGTYLKEGECMEKNSITGMAVNDQMMILQIDNISNDMSAFDLIRRLSELTIITESAIQNRNEKVSLRLLASSEDLKIAKKHIHQLIEQNPDLKISVEEEITKVTVVGSGLKNDTEYPARLYQVLSENGINSDFLMASPNSMSLIVKNEDVQKTVRAIAEAFGL